MRLQHGRVLAVVTMLAATVGAQQADVPAQGPQTGTQTMVAFDGGTAAGGAVWVDVGEGALAGSGGTPTMTGLGTLAGDTTATLLLNNARPSSPAILVVGFSTNPFAFKGGMMVPTLDLIRFVGITDAGGSIRQEGRWPQGVPSATPLYYQFWVVDDVGLEGFAATDALQSIAP